MIEPKTKPKTKAKKPYPYLVCHECGIKASKGRCFQYSTVHTGKCQVCYKIAQVTEARDYYYPIFKGFSKP